MGSAPPLPTGERWGCGRSVLVLVAVMAVAAAFAMLVMMVMAVMMVMSMVMLVMGMVVAMMPVIVPAGMGAALRPEWPLHRGRDAALSAHQLGDRRVVLHVEG